MKITCESCKAKYSIADEKVAGRTVTIRCKRCGAGLAVRGEPMAAAPAGEWHVVVGESQEGPLTVEEVASRVAGGAIDAESYVWREGMAEWLPLGRVEELARAVGVDGPEPEADLFAGGASFGVATASEPLTGTRNESSVLFSLANLEALSTPSKPSSVSAVSAAPAPARATGDGSGLIDIRALAAASASPSAPSGTTTDDLLSLGASLGAVASPLGAPVLIPMPKREGRSLAVVAVSVASVAVAAAVALAVVVLVGRGQGHAMEPRPDAIEASAAVTPPSVETPIAAPVAAPVAEPQAPAPEQPVVEAPPPELEAPRTTARESERPRPTRPRNERETARPLVVERTPAAPRTTDRLIDDVVAGRERPRAPERPTENLPPTPSRNDVMSAMNGVAGPVRACGNGTSGTVPVRVVFSGATGQVQSAQAQGAGLPPEVQSCVARAARDARVPRFAQSSFSVTYPFRL